MIKYVIMLYNIDKNYMEVSHGHYHSTRFVYVHCLEYFCGTKAVAGTRRQFLLLTSIALPEASF